MEGLIFGLLISFCVLAACRKRPQTLMKWCRWSTGLSLVTLVLLVTFVLTHEGSRTGEDPWMVSMVFVPSLALGGMLVCRDGIRKIALAAMAIGLCGVSYLWYIDHTNALVAYHRWIARGAP
jgi:peptidoglycan/LPS O-acetylase OafA/YrhL